MLTHQNLTGVFAATPTLMRGDGQIDLAANRRLGELLIAQGISGLVPLGGTGEYGSLGTGERLRVLEAVVDQAAGRVPVIPGVLSTGCEEALDTVRRYGELGADAAMVVTPYYTNPTQEGLYRYFHELADASPIPIVLYEIPYRTRIAITPEITARLSRHERIIGMKACNLDMYAFLKNAATVDDSFSMLSGEDTLFPLHVAAGARGGILATANLMPRVWQRIFELARGGDLASALALHRDLIPAIDLLFSETNPGPMKAVLDLLDIEAPGIRCPLEPAGAGLRARVRAEILRVRERYETA